MPGSRRLQEARVGLGGAYHKKTSPLVDSSTLVVQSEDKTIVIYSRTKSPDKEIIYSRTKSPDKEIIYSRTKSSDKEISPSTFRHPEMCSVNYEQTRQRMRPWLEARINSGDTQGLAWLDKDKKIFKVPWKHVGNREWREPDGKIFKDWAVHTGRYREGVDEPDWPTWKTRFRCALTKLPDIKELKEHNKLDGQTEQPYRVYQFMPRAPAGRVTEDSRDAQQVGSDESEDTLNLGGVGHCLEECIQADQASRNFLNLPTTLHTNSSEPSLDSGLRGIPSNDLIHCNSTDMQVIAGESIHSDMDIDIQTYHSEEDIRNKANKQYPGQQAPAQQVVEPPIDITDPKLFIAVKYRQEVQYEGLCSNLSGCRIFFDTHIQINEIINPDIQLQMFGPPQAQQICLPDSQAVNVEQQRHTLRLLRVLDRGLLLHIDQGNIVATRKCRCSIFVSSQSLNNGEVTKLEREQPTVIYDLNQYFKPAVQKYLHQKGPKPSTEVIISFGQRFELRQESQNNLLISATVTHAEAFNLVTRISCQSPMSPPIEMSNSDQFDKFIDMIHYQQHQDILV